MTAAQIGLVGDFDPAVAAHQAIPRALALACDALGRPAVQVAWLPTQTIAGAGSRLSDFAGLWCVPASPYASLEGALAAIRFARERHIPFLGTCGGFQHALLEYARNVSGWSDAAHAETDPSSARPVISRLACSLVEKADRIFLREGSRARRIYQRAEITESYRCNFGLNRDYESAMAGGALEFTGHDAAGEVRIFELKEHPFFMGTLFQPERSALRGESHPLVMAFVDALFLAK